MNPSSKSFMSEEINNQNTDVLSPKRIFIGNSSMPYIFIVGSRVLNKRPWFSLLGASFVLTSVASSLSIGLKDVFFSGPQDLSGLGLTVFSLLCIPAQVRLTLINLNLKNFKSLNPKFRLNQGKILNKVFEKNGIESIKNSVSPSQLNEVLNVSPFKLTDANFSLMGLAINEHKKDLFLWLCQQPSLKRFDKIKDKKVQKDLFLKSPLSFLEMALKELDFSHCSVSAQKQNFIYFFDTLLRIKNAKSAEKEDINEMYSSARYILEKGFEKGAFPQSYLLSLEKSLNL